MIIIEGPDGAGKSTLAPILRYQLDRYEQSKHLMVDNNRYWALRGSQGPINKTETVESRMRNENRYRTVHDRHYLISELANAPVLRGQPKLGEKPLALLDQLQEDCSVIIYCLAKQDSSALRQLEQPTFVLDHYQSLCESYKYTMSYLDFLGFSVLPYDYRTSLSSTKSLTSEESKGMLDSNFFYNNILPKVKDK